MTSANAITGKLITGDKRDSENTTLSNIDSLNSSQIAGNRKSFPELRVHFTVVVPGTSLTSRTGALSKLAERNMQMLANILMSKSFDVVFEVCGASQEKPVLACMQYLAQIQHVPIEKLSIRHEPSGPLESHSVRMILRRS